MTFVSLTAESTEFDTDLERAVAGIWQEVLNTPSLPGPMDNFFSLGGDSVAMIMVELRIKEEFTVQLPEGSVLTTSSLRELSQLIEEQH